MARILVVPADLIPLAGSASLLARRGIMVQAAASAAQALELSRQNQPDLIVFDSGIAEMGAAQFCRLIRSAPGLKHPQLLMLTAELGEQNDNLSEIDCDAHLISPVPDEQLLKTIASMLHLRSRDHARAAVELVAKLDLLERDQDEDTGVVVNLIDLGEGGCRIEAPVPLHIDSLGRLRFFLPGGAQRMSLYVMVRMVANELLLHYGLELIALRREDREALRRFLGAGPVAAP